MSTSRVLVTAALPYANGPLHIGHLVGYVQTDIYTRALNAMGTQAAYICANDAHGTPIELNAKKRGITPEALLAQVHAEHKRDFAKFDVVFSNFDTTHSDTNRDVVMRAYAGLKAGGFIVEREIDGNWCAQDGRFLPDRFIKGTCPKCRAADQYGDVCEKCGATYAPTDLVEPFCVLCHSTPERRPSLHAFFTLSDPAQAEFLRGWIDSGTLQPDVANYVRSWIDGGLKDWCITRDGPYFGFPVPDMENKFFYVWLDAPFGYMASSLVWGQSQGLDEAALWKSADTRIEHVIGKDIMYFHTLFWPAVLKSLGYSLPAKVHVHGMLTVDGEKMSKSRGTSITAATMAEHVEPQALRYYLATRYTPESRDMDLSLDDFVSRVNAELVNKHANLFSRVGQFVTTRLQGRLGTLPFTAAEALHEDGDTQAQSDAAVVPQVRQGEMPQPLGRDLALSLARRVVAAGRRIEAAYRERDIAQVTREVTQISEIGNEVMQSFRPWDLIREDEAAARGVCTFVANICQALSMYLAPIVPRLAEIAAQSLKVTTTPMAVSRLFGLTEVTLAPPPRLFERLERAQLDAVVAASIELPQVSAAAAEPKSADTASAAPAAKPAGAAISARNATPAAAAKPEIPFSTFGQVDLRLGTVRAAEAVPKSKKLLRLMVDLGEAEPRQILSGIAQQIAPEALLGKTVLVVANLEPAKIMGMQSFGMLVAAQGEDGGLALLTPSVPVAPGAQVS